MTRAAYAHPADRRPQKGPPPWRRDERVPRIVSGDRVVVATFRPRRATGISEDALPHIGLRCRWQALWVVDPAADSPHAGQMMWWPLGHPWFAWVPDEDLRDVEAVPVAT